MTHTSSNDDKAFGAFFLGDLISYVADHFEPDDVFGEDILKEWVVNILDPAELYTTDQLREWALSNGFVEE